MRQRATAQAAVATRGSVLSLERQIAALFAAGEEGFDWSDIRPQTVWQDAAGTVPGVLGQPVARILDKSGRGRHAIQSTTDACALLQQDAGGRYYLQLDGTNDGFGCAVAGWSTSMMVAAAIQPSTTARHVLFANANNGSRFFGVSQAGDGTATYDATVGAPNVYVDGTQVAPNTRGALSTALGTGVPHVEDSYPLNLSTFTTISFGNFIAWVFAGRFYGALAVTRTDAAAVALVRKYLGQKAGLSI